MKVILTDIDDTLLTFGQSFQQWCIDKGLETNGSLADIGSIERVLSCTRAIADELLEEYAAGDWMERIPALPDAAYVLPVLHRMGYEFVAISSCVAGLDVVRKRAKNLEWAFGFPFVAVHCVGITQPKERVLEAHQPTFWVEDNVHHATVGARIGHTSLLLNRPYNQNFEAPRATRITSWHDVLDAVVYHERRLLENAPYKPVDTVPASGIRRS